MNRHIESVPDIMNGKPKIAGRRISVQNIVIWHEKMGLSADEISSEYNLSLAEIYAALTYYFDHREEIDDAIRGDQSFVNELKRNTSSRLRENLIG